MNKRYKSEAMEALYENAVAMFDVGGISEERMRYYENACLVPEISLSQAAKNLGSASIPMKPSRVYASKAN
ncbi:MAG: hypothetical protein LBS97_06465 [Treponema sp.]|jgi:DNA-binding transcriptional regulator YiaG|nr:hypothetical protein [Treponema sp.]